MSQRPFAVVTGGSNGIGLELAREFATHGYDVLIAAEDEANLREARDDLQRSAPGAAIETHASDLASEAGVDALIAVLKGRTIDAAAINAGVGLGGEFVETDLRRELRMIDLNCRGAVQLAKHVAQVMVIRGQGRILFTSSIAATMPDPFEAVYGATKVFLRWFAQGLREELKDTGVTVTALMPSTTETNFFRRAQMMDTRAGNMKKDDPAIVAKAGFEALLAGRDRAIPTFKNKVLAAIADSLPDTLGAKQHRSLSEPGSADPQPSSKLPLALGVAAAGLGLALFANWSGSKTDGAPRDTDARDVEPLIERLEHEEETLG